MRLLIGGVQALSTRRLGGGGAAITLNVVNMVAQLGSREGGGGGSDACCVTYPLERPEPGRHASF